MKVTDSSHFVHIRRGTGATLVANPSNQVSSGQGQISSGTTSYYEIGGMHSAVTSCMIRWTDATSAATITLETTNLSMNDADVNAAAGSIWFPEPITITGPTAVAAGCFMLHFSNNGAKRARLKVVTTAITQLEIWPHGIH